ncbi:basic salivary proline-rich protein 1-like [Mustela erminea]|uniref:basic salivary proline-rich protein 1-like n=1 Tax=Mustela erminea TaxID=36723 RepID=UPI0013868644|nr:basic salivary proline-rich protein 1-like [Mustela erminea]
MAAALASPCPTRRASGPRARPRQPSLESPRLPGRWGRGTTHAWAFAGAQETGPPHPRSHPAGASRGRRFAGSRDPQRVPLDDSRAPRMPSGPSSWASPSALCQRKKASRVHPGSNMAAPMFLLLWLSWAELVRLRGAGSLAPLWLPLTGLASKAQGRGSASPSQGPRGSRQWPRTHPGLHLGPRGRHALLVPGPEPQPRPAGPCPSLSQDSPRGQPHPEGLRAPRNKGQRRRRGPRAPAEGSTARSTSRGRGMEGSRAPGPSPRPPTLDSSRGRGSAHALPCAPGPGPFPGHGYSRSTQTLQLLLSRQSAQRPRCTPHGHIHGTLTTRLSRAWGTGEARSTANTHARTRARTHSHLLSHTHHKDARKHPWGLAKRTLALLPMISRARACTHAHTHT